MSPQSKYEYSKKIQWRYRRAGKKYKQKILDEYCEVCGYERKYAIRKLNRSLEARQNKPGPKARYDSSELLAALKRFWFGANQMCSKRLKAAIPEWMPHYEEEYGTLEISVKSDLLVMSAATMDRLLAPLRVKYKRKGLCSTKPGTLLKKQIEIRTENWDITKPGFFEGDTVAHCGAALLGDFVNSLTLTDILTGWTETRATWNKGHEGVQKQIYDIEKNLPFEILGVDFDNGSEFINHAMIKYFRERKKPVTFTRSRPYHKNDNAHVEQKNWTHVRQLLGYDRLENSELVEPINDLCKNAWCPYNNFFCPSQKLKKKTRLGAKIIKHHDAPQPPYQRLLAAKILTPEKQKHLQQQKEKYNPFHLKKQIDEKLKKIFTLRQRLSMPSVAFVLRTHSTPSMETNGDTP